MRILFIAKTINTSLEENIVKECLIKQGHEVLFLGESQYTIGQYIQMWHKFKPDFILFFKLRSNQNPSRLIGEMRRAGIPSVSWIFDLFLGHPTRKMNMPLFPFFEADYVFMTDGGHDSEYEALGINKITLRQGIGSEFNYMAEEEDSYPKTDIVFVGTENPIFPYRQRLMEFLEKTYKNRFRWVGRYDDYEMRGHKLNKLYANTKIVIGDSVYSENYWSNRVYETLGRGGFLIHPRVPGMEKEFAWYKHLVPYDYSNFEVLKEKIDYFIDHDEERNKIRKAGFEFMKKNYTYDHRVKFLCDYMAKKLKK